jgi:hypothetical protein
MRAKWTDSVAIVGAIAALALGGCAGSHSTSGASSGSAAAPAPKSTAGTSSDVMAGPGSLASGKNADADEVPPEMHRPPSLDSSGYPAINAGASFDNVEVVDESLSGQLDVVRAGSQPTESNTLSVFVGLHNRTKEKLFLQVQTIYKDSSGNALNTGSWVPMTLKPKQEIEYRSVSLSDEATDFVVRIRFARRT